MSSALTMAAARLFHLPLIGIALVDHALGQAMRRQQQAIGNIRRASAMRVANCRRRGGDKAFFPGIAADPRCRRRRAPAFFAARCQSLSEDAVVVVEYCG